MTTTAAYPRIAKHGYTALRAMLEAIEIAAADASTDGDRMVEFTIGRSRYRVRQTFARLARFKAQVIRHRTAFADKAIGAPPPVALAVPSAPTIEAAPQVADVNLQRQARPTRRPRSAPRPCRRNPLTALLDAVHDAHLAAREGARRARHHIATA